MNDYLLKYVEFLAAKFKMWVGKSILYLVLYSIISQKYKIIEVTLAHKNVKYVAEYERIENIVKWSE